MYGDHGNDRWSFQPKVCLKKRESVFSKSYASKNRDDGNFTLSRIDYMINEDNPQGTIENLEKSLVMEEEVERNLSPQQ